MIWQCGATPAAPDMSWMSGLGLQGWVSGRGKVVVNGLAGMDSNYLYTVGFANSTAQYWATVSSSGAAITANMKPGTYTMTCLQGRAGRVLRIGFGKRRLHYHAEHPTTIPPSKACSGAWATGTASRWSS